MIIKSYLIWKNSFQKEKLLEQNILILKMCKILSHFSFDTIGVLIVGVDVLDDPKTNKFPLAIDMLALFNRRGDSLFARP